MSDFRLNCLAEIREQQLYIFEIVNTIHEDGKAEQSRKIRLRFMEEQKSEVSNIWHLNGYLLHSTGLKVIGLA